MAFSKKYAGLPDLDTSPDIYETPDLTDEASTLPTATVRTADSDDDVGANSDIDRRGVNADEARARFLGAELDARDVNFSDSISAKRKSYRSKSRRRRRRADGTEELGDLSDSEPESLERKLARLRREAEELKDELAKRQAEKKESSGQGQGEGEKTTTKEQQDEQLGDGLLELSRALDNLHASMRGVSAPHSADVILSQKLAAGSQIDSTAATAAAKGPQKNSISEGTTDSTTSTSSGLLAHAASFEARLAAVEAAMGISSSANPYMTEDNSQILQPVLPALDNLTSRLSTLTSTLTGPAPVSAVPTTGSGPPATTVTSTHVEALTARIKKLTADAEALAAARKRAVDAAKAAQAARIAAAAIDYASDVDVDTSSATEADPAATQRDEQAAKIQALYATLPTIQSLHPLLPSVLERLRSLRAIHAGAAQASETLDALEKRQAEMRREIEQWREGLRVVEEKMKEGEAALKSNLDVVGPWVKDLESRLARLEGQKDSS
ncbi:dynactin subunit [Thermoascus aurantiacus ATCC 26904]